MVGSHGIDAASVFGLHKRLLWQGGPSCQLFSLSIFKYKAEIKCPRCSSSNIDLKFQYMGEYVCRHCEYFWRTS